MYSQYRDERAATYKLKLIYFDGRGRGEAIRLVLAAAQRDYEDERIPLGDKKWTDLKPSKCSPVNITVAWVLHDIVICMRCARVLITTNGACCDVDC